MENRDIGKALTVIGYIILIIPMLLWALSYSIASLWYVQNLICLPAWIFGLIFIMIGRALQASAKGEQQQQYQVYPTQPPPPPQPEVTGQSQPPQKAKKVSTTETKAGVKPVTPQPQRAEPPRPPRTGKTIKCTRCGAEPSAKDISPTGRVRCPSCGMVYFS